MAKTTTYLLRDVPSDLQQAAKVAAAERGEKLRDVLVRALERYVANAAARRLRAETKRIKARTETI